jgi:hypothetical protein
MAEEIDIYSAGETEILSQDGVSHSPENYSNKSPEGKLVEIENVLQKQRDEWGAKLVELINTGQTG